MTCNGLFGLIFGHKYVPIYDKDEEQITTDDKVKLTQAAHQLCVTYEMERELMAGISKPKRTTIIYKGHYCKRCGDMKEITL